MGHITRAFISGEHSDKCLNISSVTVCFDSLRVFVRFSYSVVSLFLALSTYYVSGCVRDASCFCEYANVSPEKLLVEEMLYSFFIL